MSAAVRSSPPPLFISNALNHTLNGGDLRARRWYIWRFIFPLCKNIPGKGEGGRTIGDEGRIKGIGGLWGDVRDKKRVNVQLVVRGCKQGGGVHGHGATSQHG